MYQESREFGFFGDSRKATFLSLLLLTFLLASCGGFNNPALDKTKTKANCDPSAWHLTPEQMALLPLFEDGPQVKRDQWACDEIKGVLVVADKMGEVAKSQGLSKEEIARLEAQIKRITKDQGESSTWRPSRGQLAIHYPTPEEIAHEWGHVLSGVVSDDGEVYLELSEGAAETWRRLTGYQRSANVEITLVRVCDQGRFSYSGVASQFRELQKEIPTVLTDMARANLRAVMEKELSRDGRYGLNDLAQVSASSSGRTPEDVRNTIRQNVPRVCFYK